MGPHARRWCLALILLWALLYLPVLIGGRTPVARDLGSTHVPWRVTWRAQVATGTAPLWDPSASQGRPLLANPNTMAAYPGTALFLVLAPEAAAMAHVAIHHLILLIGCFALARSAGAGPAAAALGALAGAAGGVAFSLTTFLNSLAAFAWAPWALATVAGERRPAPLAGGALVGLSFLAGEPVTAALAGLAWLAVLAGRRQPAALPTAALFSLAALGVAAPVLAPMLAGYHETVRGVLGSAPGALAADALAPRRWPEILLPNLLGAPLGDGQSGFWAAASFPWQRYYPLLFVGGLPLLTLPAARRRGLAVWWWVAAGGTVAAITLGVAPIAAAAARLPLVASLRFAVKLLLLPTLAMPVLVAAGFERLRASGTRRLAAAILAAAALVAALPERALAVALASLYPASAKTLDARPTGSLRRAVVLDAAALGLPPAAALLGGWSPLPLLLAATAGSALQARDAFLFVRAQEWASPPPLRAALPGPRPRIVWLAAEAVRASAPGHPLDRVWRYRDELAPWYGARWGAEYLLTRGPDGLEPLRAEVIAAAVADLDPTDQLRAAAALGAEVALTGSAVAGFEATPVGQLWLTPLEPHAPPTYLAARAVPAQGPAAAVAALSAPSFRPGEDAVVEGSTPARELGHGSIREASGAPHHRHFTIDLEGASLLVVAQTYSRAWRAHVDAAPAPVVAVNGAQCGVWVPGGHHRVELRLDPLPYALGLLGPVVVLATALARRRRGASAGRQAASREPARSTPATPSQR